MLRSDFCDYKDAYIVAKGRIKVKGTNNTNRRNEKLTFKKNAPFRSCISKINNTFVDNTEDFEIIMPMYNQLEYSDNYSMASRSLWNYYRDKIKIMILLILGQITTRQQQVNLLSIRQK